MMIAPFAENTSETMYIYIGLSFVLCGLAMYLLLYQLGISAPVNAVFSFLFAICPYHYFRFMFHINLCGYHVVPLMLIMVLYAAGLYDEHDNKKRRLLMIFCAVTSGFGSPYYVFFYCMAAVIAALYYIFNGCIAEKRKFKECIVGMVFRSWPAVLTVFCALLGRVPSFIYNLQNGAGGLVERQPIESEIYSLKLILMLAPAGFSPFAPAYIKDYIINCGHDFVNENQCAALGIIGSAGFVFMMAFLVYHFFGKKEENRLIAFSSGLALSLFLICTSGSVGAIFNWVVTPQFRNYNRVSIFIYGLVALFLAHVLERLKAVKRILVYIGLAFLAVFGVIDQTTIPEGWSNDMKVYQDMLGDFFGRVEELCDEGDMIYQLPFVELSERNMVSADLKDYGHYKAYLMSNKLRWSYGIISERDPLYRDLNIDNGMSPLFIYKVKEAGFRGIYIDTSGYDGGGKAITEFYSSIGFEPVVSADGKLYYYDLKDVQFSVGK